MVDLVKIRKKAKQEEARADAARHATSTAPDSEPKVPAEASAVAAPAQAPAKPKKSPAAHRRRTLRQLRAARLP
jgi:hypothetical protein